MPNAVGGGLHVQKEWIHSFGTHRKNLSSALRLAASPHTSKCASIENFAHLQPRSDQTFQIV